MKARTLWLQPYSRVTWTNQSRTFLSSSLDVTRSGMLDQHLSCSGDGYTLNGTEA